MFLNNSFVDVQYFNTSLDKAVSEHTVTNGSLINFTAPEETNRWFTMDDMKMIKVVVLVVALLLLSTCKVLHQNTRLRELREGNDS